MSCAHPIDVDRLVAWWLGETAGPDEAALKHLPLGDGHYVLARPNADLRELVP